MNDFKECPFCLEEIKVDAIKCKHCSELLDNNNTQTETSQQSNPDVIVTEKKAVLKKDITVPTLWSLAVIIIFAFIIFMGNYHIITGSKSGMSIIKRDTFSFSDFLIPMDKITSMPYLAARSQYPVGVKALQREGIIEGHNAFVGRVKREAQANAEKAWGKTME